MSEEEKDKIKKGERDKIIMALVKMRVEKFASQKTMLDFLMNQLKYKQSYAYELMAECRKKIVEIFKEEHEDSFETYRARLEEIVESSSNDKVRLEAIKELNKLLGLHRPTRVDITSGGDKLEGFKIIFPDDKGN